MKIVTSAPPCTFVTGDIAAPGDINTTALYGQSALIDVSRRRYQRCQVVLTFVADVSTPYTQASSTLLRAYYFRPIVRCIIERAFLSSNMTSTAEVTWTIENAGGGATAGAVVPWLSSGGAVASASVDTIDSAQDRITLEAGQTYLIRVQGGGTWSLERADLCLHLLVDRWFPAATSLLPSYSPALLSDASTADAVAVALLGSSLVTEAAKLAANKLAPVPMLFVRHGLLSSTDADIRTFHIPRVASARSQGRLVGWSIHAVMASTGGSTVSAALRDETAAVIDSITANVAGTLYAENHAVLNSALTGGAAETAAGDWTLTLSQSSGAVDAVKVYVWLWISR